jgi:hypothetical protein
VQCADQTAELPNIQVQDFLLKLMIKLEKDKTELGIDAPDLDNDKVRAS